MQTRKEEFRRSLTLIAIAGALSPFVLLMAYVGVSAYLSNGIGGVVTFILTAGSVITWGILKD